MKARVKKEFNGCHDGSPTVGRFEVGDTVEGDLAAVAVREKWATVIKPKADKHAAEFTTAEAAGD